MQFWVIQTVNAIAFGSLLFLLASGFSLIFGLMKVTNLTHAAFFMFGAYLGYEIIKITGSFTLGVLIAGIVTALIGVFIYRVFLFRFHGKTFNQVLLCLGFLFVLDDLMLVFFGGIPQTIGAPAMFASSFSIFGVMFPKYRLFLILIGILVAIGLFLLVEKTKLGSLIRAGVDDEETVRAMGVNIDMIFLVVFALGTLLAAAGGVMGTPILGMEPRMSFTILPLALVVVIVGGLGNLKGAYVGSLIVAIIDSFGRALFPDLSYFVLFLPMALILTFKPSGLFGGERSIL